MSSATEKLKTTLKDWKKRRIDYITSNKILDIEKIKRIDRLIECYREALRRVGEPES